MTFLSVLARSQAEKLSEVLDFVCRLQDAQITFIPPKCARFFYFIHRLSINHKLDRGAGVVLRNEPTQ